MLALGGALAAAGVLPRTDLTAFVLYTEFISSASADVADQWTRVQEALGSASEVPSRSSNRETNSSPGPDH